MKYLAVDYGTKRIGIATSDDGGEMAFPLSVIANTGTEKTLATIVELIKKERIEAIVFGESHNLNQVPNQIMQEITPFAEMVRTLTGLPVYFMTEVYTSREATHIQGDNAQNDASAAAIILQSYLDRSRHLGS
jgi:putative Holliday junction resolvase